MPVISRKENTYMTGTLLTKTMRSGKKILYVQLSYKEPISGKWKIKQVSTGFTDRGNRKKATEMIPSIIERYSYLEQVHENVDKSFDPEISLCDYLDIWLQGKKNEIDEVTFEAYTYRTNLIKDYFMPYNLKLIDVTPRHIDQYMKYELAYGKVNQKNERA